MVAQNFPIKTVGTYFINLFDLKPYELKKTLLLQLQIFLLITTLLIVKPTVNSLFLSELGSDALPFGYVVTAFMAILGSLFYNRALERFSLIKVVQRTLWFSVASLLLFGFLFQMHYAKGFVLYVPYVWVSLFGLLTASQFWILANLVYNAREAKRVFGFIGAGAIAGGIFGGYLTSFLLQFIQTESLFFIAAALLFCCVPINRYIWRKEVSHLTIFQKALRSEPTEKSPFRLIQKSKLLSYIALVIGISVLVAKLVDYQYSDYAAKHFLDSEELASFFGFWFSTLSAVSLLIQLFFTQKVVGTFGVGKYLLWLQVGILMGSAVLLFYPELWVVVFIKVVDGSFKQSINKAATELLSIPIPIEIKKRTKTFTDVVVDSIATGLAGFILIFFINGLEIASTYVSLIIIVLILIWLVFIFYLRREYIVAFKNLLETSSYKKVKNSKTEIPITSIIGTVKKVLEEGDKEQISYMLQKTLSAKDERFFLQIKNLLMHIDPEVRTLAIENLYFLRSENLSEQMELLIHDSDQEVTTAAFQYLLKHYPQNTQALFDKYLNSSDLTISNAALIGLSLELRNHYRLQQEYQLNHAVQEAIEVLSTLTDPSQKMDKTEAILQAIGNAKLERFYPFLKHYLESEFIPVRTIALKSAAATLDVDFVNVLIQSLTSRDTRSAAISGLHGYGEPMIDILYSWILAETLELQEAVQAVEVIEHFANQKAMDTLFKLTQDTEHAVKMEAIEALKRLKWKQPQLMIQDRLLINRVLDECQLYQNTLSVIHSQIVLQHKKATLESEFQVKEALNQLMALLEQRLDRQLQRIFSLLGIKYPPQDIDPILNTILMGGEEQRIHAIEFLDNILNAPLKRQLIPLAESMITETITEDQIKTLELKVFSEVECYHQLLRRKDAKLKFAVLYLIEQLRSEQFRPLLEWISNDPNEKIAHRAESILQAL